MYLLPRLCPGCKLERIPDVKNVTEGKKKFILYICRVCKYTDLERYSERPKHRIWEDGHFVEYDSSYFDEETGK